MLRNYFITAVRFLAKNQLFTGINTLGLAVSISCTLLIYLYIKHELTYDEFHQDIDRLYVLGEGNREGSDSEAAYYQTVYPALPKMLEEFPEIETGARYFDWEGHILIAGEKQFMHQVYYVDSTFFQTLSFSLLAGNSKQALRQKGTMVISEQIAKKLFNTSDAIGKIIELEDGKVYTITGVLSEIPENSTIKPEVLIPLAEKEDDVEFTQIGNWYNTIAQVVIKLRPGVDVEAMRAKLPGFVLRHYDASAKQRILKIYPLADLRQSVAGNEIYVYGLTCISVFILLVAIINFMNLSIAGSLKRLRETGMRKVMGSTRTSIVLQFFLEASLLTLASVVISMGLLQVLLPILNDLLGMSLSLTMANIGESLLLGVLLCLVIGFVAGGYPALYLSQYKTVNAVKGIIPNYKGKVTLRNALVVVQFVVSIAMMIGVIVASRQIYFMKSADLRFNKENVLVVNLEGGYRDEDAGKLQLRGIVDQLRSRADVLSLSLSQNVPGRYWESYNVYLPDSSDEGVSLRQAYVDDEYLETYDIKIQSGRNFSTALPDTLHAAMINKSAVKALGWQNIEGKTLRPNGTNTVHHVIGVFDDFHYRSLEGDVQPLIHFYHPKSDNFLSIRIAPGKANEVLSFLQREWKNLDSWLGLNYFFVEEEFDTQYAAVERTLLLIAVFAGVAIVISCAGIFALSAIAAQQRTKEIGIRKVLGASVSSIVAILSVDFIKLVLLAMLLAIPIAWYGMSEWLADFAYKTRLEWWIFVLAGASALLIAFLTTGLQSIRAAMNNPVSSLHND